MADDNQQGCEAPPGQQEHGGALSFAAAIVTLINRGTASIFHAATRDGTLAAAFRQGAGEIGQALKALPDSIQVQQPGTLLNPTQGEIADARDVHASSHEPTPSAITRDEAGTVYGQEQAHSPAAPSPSDIVRGDAGSVHGQQQGSGQAEPSPSDIAKGQAVHGQPQGSAQAEPSPSDIAKGQTDTVHGQQQGSVQAQQPSRSDIAREDKDGQVLTHEKTWQEREMERREKANQDSNAENDQNERGKGRSLPDEQKEKEQERGRGR